MNETRMIIFTLENEWYGIDVELVRAIEKYQSVVRIPNSVPYIKGIMNLRGNVIPVCSLRQKFGLSEPENTEHTQFLVTTIGGMEVALWVDTVVGIYDIERDKMYEPPAIVREENTSYLGEIASIQERLALVLNTDNILSTEEKERVAEMMKDQ